MITKSMFNALLFVLIIAISAPLLAMDPNPKNTKKLPQPLIPQKSNQNDNDTARCLFNTISNRENVFSLTQLSEATANITYEITCHGKLDGSILPCQLIHCAALCNNGKAIDELLKFSIDKEKEIEVPLFNCTLTPLGLACLYNNIHAIKALVLGRSDVEHSEVNIEHIGTEEPDDDVAINTMDFVFRYCNDEIKRFFAEQGADANYVFSQACSWQYRNPAQVKFLLNHAKNISAVNLTQALDVNWNDPEINNLLVKRGAKAIFIGREVTPRTCDLF